MMESSLSFAIQHIESKIDERSNASARVKSEANALVSELRNVNNLLLRATGWTGLNTSHEVRRLFGELRSIAYNAEDEVDTAVVKYSALPNYFGIGGTRALKKLQMLNKRAKEVKSKLDEHFEGSNKGPISPARGSGSAEDPVPAAGNVVIGIDHEISTVVNLLTKKSNDGQQLVHKLAIVGMGGSGKTTLARSIYNHKVIKSRFQFQAWVSVSQGWDNSLLLLEILTQIRGQKSRFSLFSLFSVPHKDEEFEDEELQDESKMLVSQLNNLLYQKNCLLVFDDVWDLQALHKFIALIQGNDFNSQKYTIIITSRQTPSSKSIEWSIRQPQRLTDEECWELFSKVASNSAIPLREDYRGLAMEMLTRCRGLPLAIVALARLLKTKGDNMHEWQRVLSRITGTDATSMYGPVNEILGLSYDQLPNHLKSCFLYLGLFPEGSTISGGTLIRMWIAEGFIEPTSEESLEVAGTRYLQELIDHTMVEVVKKTYWGKVKTIGIHDIMRDFCILRARDLDFLAVSGSGPEAIGKPSRRGAVNLSNTLSLPAKSPRLRTLALFGKSSTRGVPERHSSEVNHRYLDLADLCRMYRLLRVLDIFGINSIDGTLPREIGNLIHLTYLRIRSTNIRELHKSIGKLQNLLTLDYWDVFTDGEVIVPNVLWKLKKLRHLYLPNEMSGSIEALKLHTLDNLITLWGVGGGRWMHKEMGKLSSNLRKLYIHRISDKDQLKAVLECTAMIENENLYALALDWYNSKIESLGALASKQSLRKLRLIGKSPDKLCSKHFQYPPNLEKLELYYTQLEKPETMTHLGELVGLKVLRLSKDSYIGNKWTCDKTEFPVLEELKLTDLQKLEEWEIEEGAMPCLKKLSIISCTKLKRIPKGLVHVRHLEKLDIQRMPSSFVTKLQKVKDWNDETREGEDYHIIKHIEKVMIRDSCTP
ncbi:hypothetical protein RND81_11G193500 [Saponaria officinalis]|uniref:Uncharacterized protein n=1 Tax=Saponaria officinalis TaxID=3572 RepID=A0AAW1HQ85_SAPOF